MGVREQRRLEKLRIEEEKKQRRNDFEVLFDYLELKYPGVDRYGFTIPCFAIDTGKYHNASGICITPRQQLEIRQGLEDYFKYMDKKKRIGDQFKKFRYETRIMINKYEEYLELINRENIKSLDKTKLDFLIKFDE